MFQMIVLLFFYENHLDYKKYGNHKRRALIRRRDEGYN